MWTQGPTEQEAPWPGAAGSPACPTVRGPWPAGLLPSFRKPTQTCLSQSPIPTAAPPGPGGSADCRARDPQGQVPARGPTPGKDNGPAAPVAQGEHRAQGSPAQGTPGPGGSADCRARVHGPTCFLSCRPRIRARPPVEQSGDAAPGALSEDTLPET